MTDKEKLKAIKEWLEIEINFAKDKAITYAAESATERNEWLQGDLNGRSEVFSLYFGWLSEKSYKFFGGDEK